MLAYPPTPQDDELLYSVVSRAAQLNGLRGTRHAMAHLVGHPNAMVSIDLPSRIETIWERLSPMAGIATADDLLERHTLYPYYRAFMPPDRWATLRRAALHECGTSLKAAMGILAHGVGASAQLRCCSKCDATSRQRMGSGYWHRQHHLPGVCLCLVHGEPLTSLIYQGQLGHRARLLSPPAEVTPQFLPVFQIAAQRQLARLSSAAMHCAIDRISPARYGLAYRDALRAREWLSPRGGIKWDRVIEAMTGHWGSLDVLHPMGRLSPGRDGRMSWLAGLLSNRERFHAPIAHILLIGLLFGEWPDFMMACETVEPSPRSTCMGQPRPSPVGEDQCSERCIRDLSLSCREAARRTGLSVNTIAARRRRLGLEVPQRAHQRVRAQQSIMLLLLVQGYSAQVVADQCGLSVSTVYRALAANSALVALRDAKAFAQAQKVHRRHWIRVVNAHPMEGAKKIRERARASFAWLYRHDHSWLQDHRPQARSSQLRHGRVDWAARDAWLADRMNTLTETLLAGELTLTGSSKKPTDSQWVPLKLPTRAGLIATVYHDTPVRKHSKDLPLFLASLRQAIEKMRHKSTQGRFEGDSG